jgi:hypothetical protein
LKKKTGKEINEKGKERKRLGRENVNTWYDTLIVFLYNIHHPIVNTHNVVSETGFYLRLQVKPMQLVSIDRASPFLCTNTR